MATERQLKLLNTIVSIYVKSGDPVSSAVVIEVDEELNLSSATIRSEMVFLEKEGYITKLDPSSSRTSGRIPTNKGYERYLKHIKTNPDNIQSIKKEMDLILGNRKESIDDILSKALNLINDSTNTLTISKNYQGDNKLVDIHSYPVGINRTLVIIVTSSGEVINKEIDLNEIKYSDFEKVIKTYLKRLKGISILDLDKNLLSLKEIISMEVNIQEDRFQEMIKILFSKVIAPLTTYQGMNSLISANSLDIKTQVKTIFKMIENNSIWDLINEEGAIETESVGITVDINIIEGISFVNKSINLGTKTKQLTILGSKNQDYEKLFSMLEYLERNIKGDD